MAKGYGILIGVENVSPGGQYELIGPVSPCEGAEYDVNKMYQVLEDTQQDFTLKCYKGHRAKSERVLGQLQDYVARLVSDDLLVVFFAGHGGQVADYEDEEKDGLDESLYFYDRPVIDDELRDIFKCCAEGSKVLMISDSCHSGTNFKMAPKKPTFNCMMLHMGSSRDDQLSYGFPGGGVYTSALYNVWDRGRFKGSYVSFHNEIAKVVRRYSPRQSPVIYRVGPASFYDEQPFSF